MGGARGRAMTEKTYLIERSCIVEEPSLTSFTARCAVALSGHAGFARADGATRR
jgi:hypothetical protein